MLAGNSNRQNSYSLTNLLLIGLIAAFSGCRSSQSNLNEDDPFATSEEEIAKLKQDSRPEYLADWQIEFVSRTHILRANQLEEIKDETVLVTKDNKQAQTGLVAFLNPTDTRLKLVGECRQQLFDNIQTTLLPLASVGEDTTEAGDQELNPITENVKSSEPRNIKPQPNPEVEDLVRTVLKDAGAKSIHYRLVVLVQEKWEAHYPNGFIEVTDSLPKENAITKNCGIVDLQLRWVFQRDQESMPKNIDGTPWWDGYLDFGTISPRNPQMSVSNFQKSMRASKILATRRFSIEDQANGNPLLDNLR